MLRELGEGEGDLRGALVLSICVSPTQSEELKKRVEFSKQRTHYMFFMMQQYRGEGRKHLTSLARHGT